MLLSTGGIVWAYALLVLVLITTVRQDGRFERLTLLAVPICYWATLLFGPMVLARYEMCLFTALPVCVLSVFTTISCGQSHDECMAVPDC